MILYTPPKTAQRLPVIDFADAFSPDLSRREAVAWEIHKISRDVGFFYLVNHDVPQSLIDGQFDWTRRFFGKLSKANTLGRLWGWAMHHYAWNASGGRDDARHGRFPSPDRAIQFSGKVLRESTKVRKREGMGMIAARHRTWFQILPRPFFLEAVPDAKLEETRAVSRCIGERQGDARLLGDARNGHVECE